MIQIEFGRKIQELRKETGLSQEKFALKIGMDRTYYASVEYFVTKYKENCRWF